MELSTWIRPADSYVLELMCDCMAGAFMNGDEQQIQVKDDGTIYFMHECPSCGKRVWATKVYPRLAPRGKWGAQHFSMVEVDATII